MCEFDHVGIQSTIGVDTIKLQVRIVKDLQAVL